MIAPPGTGGGVWGWAPKALFRLTQGLFLHPLPQKH